MRMLLVMSVISSLEALHCDKEFNFVDSVYEKGYDITCQGLTNNYTSLLRNINIINEISLKMENCTLTGVSSEIFQNVHNIKHLYLENSIFTFSQKEPIFETVKQLEQLTIINTRFNITKYSLSNLFNLKRLTLSNNELTDIQNRSFKDLFKLATLQITQNNLTDITNVPLCELKNLKTLNFSRNYIANLSQGFSCRNSEPTSNLNMKNLGSKQKTVTPNVSSTELSQIDLSFNNISDLGASFALLKSLRVVKLHGNKLQSVNNSYFTFLDYLEDLQISNNVITVVEDDVFKHKQYLEKVDISNNKIKMLNFQYLGSVKYLNLADNDLQIDCVLSINGTNRLSILLLNNNKITDIKPNTFKKYVSLKKLELANNNIKLVDLSLTGLVNLTHLCISNNSIEVIPRGLFKDLRSLRVLDMSLNRLIFIKYNDTFSSLKNLESLNLSGNFLTNLNYGVLQHLKSLNILDISHNKLNYFDYDVIMSNLPTLSLLNIKFNDLSCELLSKIIIYLRTKGVSYTVQQAIDTDKVNVGGIYCRNERAAPESSKFQTHTMFNVALGFVVILVTVILCIIIFKVHIYLKRRKYRADEFELIAE